MGFLANNCGYHRPLKNYTVFHKKKPLILDYNSRNSGSAFLHQGKQQCQFALNCICIELSVALQYHVIYLLHCLMTWYVRLSRLLVGFRTHFKSLHFLLLLLLLLLLHNCETSYVMKVYFITTEAMKNSPFYFDYNLVIHDSS